MPEFITSAWFVTLASAVVTFGAILALGLILLRRTQKNANDRTTSAKDQILLEFDRLMKKSTKKRRMKALSSPFRYIGLRLQLAVLKLRRFGARHQGEIIIGLCLLALFIFGFYSNFYTAETSGDSDISCYSPRVIDGDTFDCDGERIRLAGIDAPEMPGHCRPGRRCTEGDPYASKTHLDSLTTGLVECWRVETDHYGRMVARCKADGEDLSCSMIEDGQAVRRYGHVSCP